MLHEYRRIAHIVGEPVEDIALEAIREKFASLVAAEGKKKRGKAS
jgi:hypothetical protein